MKRILSDKTNSQVLKKTRQPEALQELYHLQPEFNNKQKRILSDKTNSQVLKKTRQPEALQELYHLQPEFNNKQGQESWETKEEEKEE
ncbi:hypothetical protein Glove_772g1 [Diversispora epigaea]|uniref:Uncharacterized protein n=1 Tax=Diversispora epigaea TaxID=1348612 RepID=A0A397FZY0_9GLOM|nr:hypothetical protein Glove_772g1 [Diversispora epigaea]